LHPPKNAEKLDKYISCCPPRPLVS